MSQAPIMTVSGSSYAFTRGEDGSIRVVRSSDHQVRSYTPDSPTFDAAMYDAPFDVTDVLALEFVGRDDQGNLVTQQRLVLKDGDTVLATTSALVEPLVDHPVITVIDPVGEFGIIISA
jgi:hypothetical protein